MSEIAIQVDGLSKRYQIGARQRGYKTMREGLTNAAGAPFRAIRSKWQGTSDKNPSGNNSIWALKDISFEVKRGEALGLIGPNGSGKSTLLKILSRITEPTHGVADIHGRVSSLLEVGTGFHPELTGRENVYLNGAILGMRKQEIDRKFDEIVAFSEVEKFIDTQVKRYSSGMYLRLAFAVAAHLEPEILLVDEVLAVGDAAFQKKCLGKMGDATREGRTVFLVSHNMAMIENLCERAILLHKGAIAKDGAPREVISSYLDKIWNSSGTSLLERTDRKGEGELIATAIEFLDPDEKTVSYPSSGQPLVIRLHYKTKSDRVFRNCRVSISVHRNERAYFLLSTELVDKTQLDLSGNGHVDFILPELPLSESDYSLASFIESNGTIQDAVTGAAELPVIDGDFFGTGRNYPDGWRGQSVLVRHHWTVGNGRQPLSETGSEIADLTHK